MPGDFEDGARFSDGVDEYAPINLGPVGRNYEPAPYGYETYPRSSVTMPDSYGAGAGPYDYTPLRKLRGMEAPYYLSGDMAPTATAYARPSAGAYAGDRSYVRNGEYDPDSNGTLMERFTPDFGGMFSGKPLSSDTVFLLFVIIIALVIVLGIQSMCHRSERTELLQVVQNLRERSPAAAAAAPAV